MRKLNHLEDPELKTADSSLVAQLRGKKNALAILVKASESGPAVDALMGEIFTLESQRLNMRPPSNRKDVLCEKVTLVKKQLSELETVLEKTQHQIDIKQQELMACERELVVAQSAIDGQAAAAAAAVAQQALAPAAPQQAAAPVVPAASVEVQSLQSSMQTMQQQHVQMMQMVQQLAASFGSLVSLQPQQCGQPAPQQLQPQLPPAQWQAAQVQQQVGGRSTSEAASSSIDPAAAAAISIPESCSSNGSDVDMSTQAAKEIAEMALKRASEVSQGAAKLGKGQEGQRFSPAETEVIVVP